MQTQLRPHQLTDTEVLDRLPVAVYVCDRHGRIVRFNDRAVGVWGRRPAPDECYCGSQRAFRRDGTVLPRDQSPVADALSTGQAVRDAEILIERPDASRLTVVMNVAPVFDDARDLAGVVSTIHEITRIETQDALRAKDELLATVAHELRQPIHAAAVALGVMAQRPGRERTASARATVERQLQQMSRIVEDLLNAERIVRGDVELRREVADICTTVRQMVDAVSPLLVQRAQRFDVDLPDAPIPARIDEARIQQALMNVLTNATKYTAQGGCISLTVTDHGDTLDIGVADNGRGIDAAAMSRIFDLFARDAPDSHGCGIGLAVARRPVELHGGRIHARSAGRGHGSEFVITLPTARGESRTRGYSA